MNERNDNDFVYELTKIVAESDSIGEGYGYCNDGGYKRKEFDDEVSKLLETGNSDSYVYHAGMLLYKKYLAKISVLY